MAGPLYDVATVPVPPAQKRIVTLLIMLCTMMVTLDATIANVALPHMRAALGASPDTISWVLTSYILATAVATPMTGWLAGRIGRRALFAIAVLGFTISSALCGLSVSLPMMVFSRLMQGLFGAFIVPMSQSCMYDMNPPSEQARALTIWGMGVMVGPVIGPVLGGYLTDAFDWRWVFFINVPIGVLSFAGILTMLPLFPSIARAFDRFGFVLMVVALCGLQLVLDRGTQKDWFDSTEIIVEAGLSAAAFWMLVIHLRGSKQPLIPLALFGNRNFVTALVFVFFVGAITTAGSALLAPMTQTLLGYPVLDAGLLMMPRGIGMIAAMQVAGRLLPIVDSRFLIFAGLSLTAASLWMMTGFDLDMSSGPIITSGVLLGAGMGFAIAPSNLMSVSTLDPKLRTDGAAIYSLVRNIGSSIVVAITSALLARNMQVSHSDLGASVTAIDIPFLMPGLVERAGISSSTLLAAVNAEVDRQALMIAYLDDYWLMMWATIALIPLVLVMKPTRARAGEHVPVGE